MRETLRRHTAVLSNCDHRTSLSSGCHS